MGVSNMSFCLLHFHRSLHNEEPTWVGTDYRNQNGGLLYTTEFEQNGRMNKAGPIVYSHNTGPVV